MSERDDDAVEKKSDDAVEKSGDANDEGDANDSEKKSDDAVEEKSGDAKDEGDEPVKAAPAVLVKRPPTRTRRRTAAKTGKPVSAVGEVAVTPPPVRGTLLADQRAARRTLALGGTLGAIGLALVGVGPSDAGMAITLAGLVALIYGIHTFGRLGSEPAR